MKKVTLRMSSPVTLTVAIRLQPSETLMPALAPLTPFAPLAGGGGEITLVWLEPLFRTVRVLTGLKASIDAIWLVWTPGLFRFESKVGCLFATAVKLMVQLCPGCRPTVAGGVKLKVPGVVSAIAQVPAGQAPPTLLPVELRVKTPGSTVGQSLEMIVES